MPEGKFIMIDGIDGSGKSTIVKSWKEYLANEGKKIFDLKEFWKTNNYYPGLEQLADCDFVFSHEPTSAGIGKVIREELIRNGTSYPNYAIAEAYALDRLVLYNKTLLPALEAGKTVISDRAVSTSLCYQHISEPEPLSLDAISKIPGNSFVLAHPPQHLILMDVDPEVAFSRLNFRRDKQDDAIFEKLDFLKKAAEVFRSTEYQQVFTSRGTVVHHLPGNDEIAIIRAESIKLLNEILSLTTAYVNNRL